MEKYKKNLVEFASNLIFEYKENPSVIPYSPQKTKVMQEHLPSLTRSIPEHHGVPSEVITELLTKLEAQERANVHSIMVVKDGAVISECSRPGFSTRLPHLAHSMSKSVTGILILMLESDGKLDTGARVTYFFPELTPADKRFEKLTVEHLLCMKSGVGFGEVGVVSDTEWTRAFFESDMNFEPGEKFAYNTMNTYILMRIADKITRKEYGISAERYLYDRLFAPLGIEKPFWEYGPEGVMKGGFGLYLSAEEWAKIGIMMLNRGIYFGRKILDEEAVSRAVSTHAITTEKTGDFDYGYQIWVGRDSDEFLFNGMFGQNVWICPQNNIVVSLTSGNNELFQKGPALAIIREVLGGDIPKSTHRTRRAAHDLECVTRGFFQSRGWIKPHEPLRGWRYFLHLSNRTPFNTVFDSILGKYDFPKNNQGLLPVFVRSMQNNFQGGIKSFTFERAGDLLRLTAIEGEQSTVINFGFYSLVKNTVSFTGENYLIYAVADAVEESNGDIIYKLELIFPELPNTRRITITLSNTGRLNVRMREIPDERIADAIVDAIPALSGKAGFLYDMLEKNLGKNFIQDKLEELFAPEFVAISEKAPDHDAALEYENEKIAEKISASALVRSLIFRFLGNDEKVAENPGGALAKLAGFFGKFFQ